jgi:hypothetical protein
MRTVGIVAIFVLSLCAIGEGAYLISLSRKVDRLSQQQHGEPAQGDDGEALRAAQIAAADRAARRSRAAGSGALPAPSAVPSFQALAPASTTPATSTLREALATTEGRDQLKAALAVIEEEKRQTRMLERGTRSEERDKRYKERLTKAVALTGDEPLKIDALLSGLTNGRRQILEEMKGGGRSAEQADDAIDELEDGTEQKVRALLGEDRWRKFREEQQQGGGQQPPGQPGQPPPGQPGSTASR